MATAYQRDQWRRIESADSGAESGSEEVAIPADPAEPWKIRGAEYIFAPAGICRSVNSDQAPLINVEGRPPVQTACSRPGKPQYGGKCRYHATSINQAPPNMIYARLCGNPNRFVVPSQRALDKTKHLKRKRNKKRNHPPKRAKKVKIQRWMKLQ